MNLGRSPAEHLNDQGDAPGQIPFARPDIELTRLPSLRAMTRKPSCLISCSQNSRDRSRERAQGRPHERAGVHSQAKGKDMNHHHRVTLHALFAHPISANIDFKKVMHLLEDAGAEVENRPKNRVAVKLQGQVALFTHAHRDLSKDEVVQVRKFLESCGFTPAKFPLSKD
jgi:hypothetical protein